VFVRFSAKTNVRKHHQKPHENAFCTFVVYVVFAVCFGRGNHVPKIQKHFTKKTFSTTNNTKQKKYLINNK
jgi:hypothetical protein